MAVAEPSPHSLDVAVNEPVLLGDHAYGLAGGVLTCIEAYGGRAPLAGLVLGMGADARRPERFHQSPEPVDAVTTLLT